MSDTTAQPAEQADAPAPLSFEDSLAANYEKAIAEPAAEATEAPAREAPSEPDPSILKRAADGRFVAADAPDAPAGSEAPAEAEAAPAAPEQPQPPPIPQTPDYLRPYEADFAMRGVPIDQAVPFLLDTWRQLDANPQATLQQLAGRYGLAISFAGQQPPGQQPAQQQDNPDEWVDPAVLQLRQEVAALREMEQRRAYEAQMAEQYALQSALGQVSQQIADFGRSKGLSQADFEELMPVMTGLINAGAASDLETAYSQAVHAIPKTRAAILEAERKQSEAAAAKQAAEKAAAARRAAVVNVRSDSAMPARSASIEDSLARAYDNAQAS